MMPAAQLMSSTSKPGGDSAVARGVFMSKLRGLGLAADDLRVQVGLS